MDCSFFLKAVAYNGVVNLNEGWGREKMKEKWREVVMVNFFFYLSHSTKKKKKKIKLHAIRRVWTSGSCFCVLSFSFFASLSFSFSFFF